MTSSFDRVLVTGGAGFIGSELVRQLAEAGSHVTVADNLVNGRSQNLDGLPADRVRLEVVDIRDKDAMASLVSGAAAVFHLACLGVRHSIHAPAENHSVNATATLDLLAMARDTGLDRFVYVSTSEIYGSAQTVPMNEDHPARPTTVYGASKLAGEAYARAFHRTHGLAAVVVRPFNTFGPRCHHEGDSGEVIPKFMLRCLAGEPMLVFGSGGQTRDFSYVSDIARGILAAATNDGAVGATINLGSGRETSIAALTRAVSAALSRPGAITEYRPARPGDVMRLCADTTRASEMLGFETAVELAEGLGRLHEWYLSQGESARQLLAAEVEENWESSGLAAEG